MSRTWTELWRTREGAYKARERHVSRGLLYVESSGPTYRAERGLRSTNSEDARALRGEAGAEPMERGGPNGNPAKSGDGGGRRDQVLFGERGAVKTVGLFGWIENGLGAIQSVCVGSL
jgi:hypothetical protein